MIKEQSLHITAPSSSSQFDHHISLLTSRKDSQRKDSLSYLTSAITNHPANTPLPEPVGVLLPKLLPLITDANDDVRAQLVKLLRALPSDRIGHHVAKLLPYIRAGLHYPTAAMRSSTLDVLDWALGAAGQNVVTAPGGWVKMLESLMSMLNWSSGAPTSSKTTTGWTSGGSRSLLGKGVDDKVFTHALQTLSSFLHVGLVPISDDNELDYAATLQRDWPLRHVRQHMMPRRPNAFGYLNLFGTIVKGNEAYEDRTERQAEFRKRFQPFVEKEVKALKLERGGMGNVAAKVEKAMVEAMADYEDPEAALKEMRKRRRIF